jgi:hypothetical protein
VAETFDIRIVADDAAPPISLERWSRRRVAAVIEDRPMTALRTNAST